MAESALSDIDHTWGDDIAFGPTGDIATVTGADRSRQAVLRRLLTCPKDYLWHPDYGAGLPAEVGQNVRLARARGIILGQMQLEDSVQRTPPPVVEVREILNGVQAEVRYIALPDKQPVLIQFAVEV